MKSLRTHIIKQTVTQDELKISKTTRRNVWTLGRRESNLYFKSFIITFPQTFLSLCVGLNGNINQYNLIFMSA